MSLQVGEACRYYGRLSYRIIMRWVSFSLTHCAVLLWVLPMSLWLFYVAMEGEVHHYVRLSDERLYAMNLTEALFYQRHDTFLDAQEPDDENASSADTTLRDKLEEYEKRIYQMTSSKEQCTMVIQTYKRAEILPRVIKHYCTMIIFHKVVIVWNDVNTTIPQSLKLLNKNCVAHVQFVVPKENLLTNRFVPRKEIETDCVCLSDDDRIVYYNDVRFGFEVWRNFRHRVVGFEERSVLIGADKAYLYGFHERKKGGHSTFGSWTRTYSIMLMTACFVHKAYLELYFDPQMIPPSVLDYVNDERNCEDILLSVLVTKFLKDIGRAQCGVIAVEEKKAIKNLDMDRKLKNRGRLSSRGDHFKHRSDCLNRFTKLFGYLPLKTSRIMVEEEG